MKASLDDRLFSALEGGMTPKFLATKDENQIPNVVPIISIQPYDQGTLIFGNFLMAKTASNLEKNDLVTVTVFTERLFGATIRGRFQGFQKVGEYADIVNASDLLRYNAYTGIRNAGSIVIEDISEPFQLTKTEMLTGFVQSKIVRALGRKCSRGKTILHPLVSERFGRIAAVKVLCYVDSQGYPCAVPVMTLQPAAADVMVFSKNRRPSFPSALEEEAEIAATVITMEPVAFQVKGTYKSLNKRWGAILLKEAYHASPPYVGKRIA